MKFTDTSLMAHYKKRPFSEQKEAANIFSLMVFIYIYSSGMVVSDLAVYGDITAVLISSAMVTMAMTIVIVIWYYGWMDVAIFIAGLYGIGMTLIIFFEDQPLRFYMQLFMVLLVTIIGYRKMYQYIITVFIIAPLVIMQMTMGNDVSMRYIIFITANLWVTTYMILYLKQILTSEIEVASSLKIAQETDVLTGLPNRRHFENNLRHQMSQAPTMLLAIDMDHFKRINDKYGHPRGDQVLMMFSDILRTYTSDTIQAFRWGGEEFVMVLRGSHVEGEVLAENIRLNTEKHDFGIEEQLTVSIGLSDKSFDTSQHEDWFIRADKALYMAKAKGRNTIETLYVNP